MGVVPSPGPDNLSHDNAPIPYTTLQLGDCTAFDRCRMRRWSFWHRKRSVAAATDPRHGGTTESGCAGRHTFRSVGIIRLLYESKKCATPMYPQSSRQCYGIGWNQLTPFAGKLQRLSKHCAHLAQGSSGASVLAGVWPHNVSHLARWPPSALRSDCLIGRRKSR